MVYKYCFVERRYEETVQSVNVCFFNQSGLSEHLIFRSSRYRGPEYKSKVEQPCNDKMASVINLLGMLGWRMVGRRPAIYDHDYPENCRGDPLFEYAATTAEVLAKATEQLMKGLEGITEFHD